MPEHWSTYSLLIWRMENYTQNNPGPTYQERSNYLSSRLTVCITTKDRQEDIDNQFQTLSALGLQSLPIRVIDDGSIMPIHLRAAAGFSNAELIRHDRSEGLVERRNALVREAHTPFVLSLDDDSSLVSSDDLVDVLREMEQHTDWAVVGFTILDRERGSELPSDGFSGAPMMTQQGHFVGCGYIANRTLFLRIGGYSTALEYIGEERDFSMRAIANGYEILLVQNRFVLHHRSTVNRDFGRLAEYTARNIPDHLAVELTLRNKMADVRPVCIGDTTLESFQKLGFETHLSGIFAG